jgi:Helicase conserved C-terminal domain
MSTLDQLDKNHFNEVFLDLYKQRLTGKPQPILPQDGQLIELNSPASQNLVGSIGPRRNPEYDGPQPPNSIGMVLLVTPSQNHQVACCVSGRFDISHRYIPGIDLMRNELLYDGGKPRPKQAIADCYKRFTVPFDEITFTFSIPNDLGKWAQDNTIQDVCLKQTTTRLALDPRIFRTRSLTPTGRAKIVFDWSDGIQSQKDLNKAISNSIFAERATCILEYQVELRARIREAPHSLTTLPGALLLEIYLVNQTLTDEGRNFGLEDPFLLDCELAVSLHSGKHHLLPHKLKPEDYRHHDNNGLVGYGITCAVKQNVGGELRTNCMPVIRQWAYETPSLATVGMNISPSFAILAKDPFPVLDSLIDALNNYAGQWVAKISSLTNAGRKDEAQVARKDAEDFKNEIARICRGRDLLASNPDLLKAFTWMNDVMGAAIARQGKNFDGWRLFQLGFILTQIEAIYERHAPQPTENPSWDQADVLWFSTGGGKTEAYLGIICMAMLYQRLKKRNYGTSAWLRFPLRMLSVQQFQRLSYVVAQANILRQDKKLGGHPFTIGYFTGGGTPASISSTSEFYQESFLPTMSDEALDALKFISDCPYCDAKHSATMKRDNVRFRIKHVCNNPDCWSNTQAELGAYGEGIRGEIGIYVSDEECYRYLPTVLVGTIDKLAVIAHNVRFSKFFGSSRFFCPEHGFTREGVCEHFRVAKDQAGDSISVRCGNNSRTSAIKTVSMPPMVDPGFPLGIQDELHLLKETLGNFDGHYETLLQALQVLHGGHPPKILAATATIKDYKHHIHHLYQKEAVAYPAPGIEKGESFYSRRKFAPEGTPLVRRYFCGLLPVTRRSPVMRSVSDASSRFFDLVDEVRGIFRNNPAQAAALFKLDPAKAPAVLGHLETHLNTNLIYVNKKRSISEIGRFLEDENGKRGTDRVCTRLDGESTLEQIQETIEHVEHKLPNDPRRQVIATSVVSHGVDIERLNFMILAGWPTSTAEYIQSSARSGRIHPGIVLTVLSHMNLYEYNVFLNFADYHHFLDKMVESVPINRFAPNILERTLPGILSAVILNWASCQPWGIGVKGGIRDVHKILNEPGNPARKEIEKAVLMALHVDPTTAKKWFDKRVVEEFTQQTTDQIKRGLNRLESWSGGLMDMYLSEALTRIYGYGPLRSFRDIERQIGIDPINESREMVIDALRR